MKQQLVVDCLDFNAIIGFRLFNPPRDRTLNLGVDNVVQGFAAVGVTLSREQARLIIKRYDDDRDGMLTFTNIRDIFKPRDHHLSQEFARRLPFDHKKQKQDLSYKTLNCLRTLFHKTLQVEQNIEMFKQAVQRRPDFDFSAAFETINRVNPTKNEDYISMEEFKQILKSHGVYALDRDIQNLFDRFDKDHDGTVTFKDFSNEMMTVSQTDQVATETIFPYRSNLRPV